MQLIKLMGLAGYQRSICNAPLAKVLIERPRGSTFSYYHSTGEALLIGLSSIGPSIYAAVITELRLVLSMSRNM